MDADRFESLLRSFTSTPSRRGVAHTLAALAAAGVLGPLLGLSGAEAKRKKKKKKRKPVVTVPPPPPLPLPPPPPAETCTDGVKNGSESDVDCGGTCPRCAVSQACVSRHDCDTSYCV